MFAGGQVWWSRWLDGLISDIWSPLFDCHALIKPLKANQSLKWHVFILSALKLCLGIYEDVSGLFTKATASIPLVSPVVLVDCNADILQLLLQNIFDLEVYFSLCFNNYFLPSPIYVFVILEQAVHMLFIFFLKQWKASWTLNILSFFPCLWHNLKMNWLKCLPGFNNEF